MYYNIHGMNSGLGCKETHIQNAKVSGPDETLKGYNLTTLYYMQLGKTSFKEVNWTEPAWSRV
jgi:hypothetical protein